MAKISKKENTNNSFIKYKQKTSNYLESSAPQKNIKDKKKSKNSNRTLPLPTKNVNQKKVYKNKSHHYKEP